MQQSLDLSHPVLYVDPEWNNLARFRLSFEKEHSVRTTSSPDEALRILAEEPVAVLLVETDGRGIELVEATRELHPEVIRLAVGCSEEDGSLARAMESGVADVLVGRPWRVGELRASLRHAMERYHLEGQVRSLRRQVERSSRLSSLSFATAGIAHDMKTPLTSLMAGLDLLGKQVERMEVAGGAALSREMRQVLAACNQSTLQLRSLMDAIRGLLHERPRIGTIHLGEAIEAALLLCRSEILTRADLEVDTAEAASIQGDSTQITQLLLNLVSNALQAMEDLPQGERRLRLIAARQEGRAVLRVEDNGRGVPAAAGARIFEPFFSTRTDGTGLGLVIVREIAERHRAEVRVEPRAGGGTVVSVLFPLA